MLDFHNVPDAHWGIWPVMFNLGGIEISSYFFFVSLGFIAGGLVFLKLFKKQAVSGEHTIYIVMAALFGGSVGAKIPIMLLYSSQLATNPWEFALSGKTIIGGLIGGMVAVFIVKKMLKIKGRIGNALAPAVALGMAIGRIGCFLTGCCYGVAAEPIFGYKIGVDFGDGVLRHPTQLYEAGFCFLLFLFLIWFHRQKSFEKFLRHFEGFLFDVFLAAYFLFRFTLEFIKQESMVFAGLTIFQWISLLVLIRSVFRFITFFKYYRNQYVSTNPA